MSELAFGNVSTQSWINGLKWRLEKMPDVTVFVRRENKQLVGYKAGYATANNRYYSWLGAVHPNFHRQGVARILMQAQHNWLQLSRFNLLETQVAQKNTAMKALNLGAGLETSGLFSKNGEPYLIMEKKF